MKEEFVILDVINAKNEKVAETKVSKVSAAKIGQKRLNLSSCGYVKICVDSKNIQLSHFVTSKPAEGMVKDHINRDKLNNCISNLRDVTPGQNGQNKLKQQKKCSSKYIGVCFVKRTQKWYTTLQYEKKYVFRDYFNNETEAARSYDLASVYYYGLFAATNNLLSDQEKLKALNTIPFSKARKRKPNNLPKGLKKSHNGFIVSFTEIDGKNNQKYFKNEEEATICLMENKNKIQLQKDQRHAAKTITKDENNNTFIHVGNGSFEQKKCLVDEEFWYILTKNSWRIGTGGYPMGDPNGKTVALHRFVWLLAHPNSQIEIGFEIDHIFDDKLDCRIQSLQKISRSSNQQKKRKRSGTCFQYKGVSCIKRKYWQAAITYNYKKYFLGRFKTETEARDAYELVAKKLHGQDTVDENYTAKDLRNFICQELNSKNSKEIIDI